MRSRIIPLGAVCVLLTAALHAQSEHHSGAVDAGERSAVIDQVLGKLRESYVREDVARTMDAEIRARETAGSYDGLTDAGQFVQALTRDLQAVSRDKHLVVEFSAEPPASPRPPSEAEAAGQGNPWRSQDCLFVNVAVLAGNVGYIKFDAFRPPGKCAETAAAAMSMVTDCDALVIDLRDNAGGDPGMVAFMSSYFFSQPVHLSDVYERRTNATVESWTLPFVPGRRFIGKPLFVLTSPRTFSGAEEFAYNLQMLKRAVIIGETSGGAAHLALPVPIGAHFRVVVPVARYVNPISRTNWEGKGVKPDIRAREEVAVQAAYRSALEGVTERMTPSTRRDAIQRQIDVLTTVINARR